MAGLLPTLELLAAAFRALTAYVPISSFCKDTIVLIDWLCCVIALAYSGRYSIGGMSRSFIFLSPLG